MRFKSLLLTLGIVANGISCYAGDVPGLCAEQKQKHSEPSFKGTSATPEEDYYDVLSLKFNIALGNTSTAVSGNVTVRARVVAANMSVYAFELNNLLTIDSVKINNQLLSVATSGAIRKVTLPVALTAGSVFTAQVFYHGQTPPATQFFDEGVHIVNLGNYNILYTMSDKDNAEDWWPSKQSIQDKIDTVDMWVTVDDSLKAGSNGLLQNTVTLPGNKKRYEWKTQYPIDYYLISVAVAPYNEYSYFMHYTDGSNDSMLVQNYYYNTNALTAAEKASFDSVGLMIDHFSALFGRYPFDKEKYGHCMSPISGGMEHQTMTTMGTMGFNSIALFAHELGHQWWGNSVTYGTWSDIWLSEGLASYCEQLFVEKFNGAQAVLNYRKSDFSVAMSQPTGSVYVYDTTNVNTIFSYPITYRKGSAVTHMLRYMAPADSLFFKVLRRYQSQYKFGLAYTNNLKIIAEQEYGINLDSFFRQWIYGQGYPTYGIKWAQQGNTVVIQINQTTSAASSVPCFWMPIQFKLKSAAGDKIITLYNNANSQIFVTNWDNEMTGIEIDPGVHILKKSTNPVKDPAILHVKSLDAANISVFPNPADDEWYVKNIPANATCKLIDVNGKLLWQQVSSYYTTVPAKQLPKGTYYLLLNAPDTDPITIRLVK